MEECDTRQDNHDWDYELCDCVLASSPLVIDLTGDGFSFTDVAGGVMFDLLDIGTPVRTAWTTSGQDPFVVLDRNGNGQVDSGRELFGNRTPQPPAPVGVMKNGFLALAVFDTPAAGGNGDGVISSADTIFSSLRLWFDGNHDGVSQGNELMSLAAAGVAKISLDYKERHKLDEHDNILRYRSEAQLGQSAQPGFTERAVVDVFFLYTR